jgi:hypothetical protein
MRVQRFAAPTEKENEAMDLALVLMAIAVLVALAQLGIAILHYRK